MTCGKCGKNNADNSMFCTGCGGSLVVEQPRVCTNCGSPLEARNPFCGRCGKQVGMQSSAPSQQLSRQPQRASVRQGQGFARLPISSSTIIGIVCSVVAVVAIIVLIVTLTGGNDEQLSGTYISSGYANDSARLEDEPNINDDSVIAEDEPNTNGDSVAAEDESNANGNINDSTADDDISDSDATDGGYDNPPDAGVIEPTGGVESQLLGRWEFENSSGDVDGRLNNLMRIGSISIEFLDNGLFVSDDGRHFRWRLPDESRFFFTNVGSEHGTALYFEITNSGQTLRFFDNEGSSNYLQYRRVQ